MAIEELESTDDAGPAAATDLTAELDFSDPNSIVFFGARVQRELARISDRMLRQAAGDPVGAAAADLDQMLTLIRGFRPEDTGPVRWWQRLFGGGPVAALVRQIAGLLQQMDVTAAALERRKTQLLTESVTMGRLAAKSRHYYERLGQYEQAARLALARVPDGQRGDLLQRAEDLALSRQIAQQSLATMAVSEQVSRDLLTRLNAVLDHTLVLWKQHMTQVIAICRGRQTADAIADLADKGQGLAAMSQQLAKARQQLAQRRPSGDTGFRAVVVANQGLELELAEGAALAGQAQTAAQTARQLLDKPGP